MERLTYNYTKIAKKYNRHSGFYYTTFIQGAITLGLIELSNQNIIELDEKHNFKLLKESDNPLAKAIDESDSKSIDSVIYHLFITYRDEYYQFLVNQVDDVSDQEIQQIKNRIDDFLIDKNDENLITFVNILRKFGLLDCLYNRKEVRTFKKHLKEIKFDENSIGIKVMNQINYLASIILATVSATI